MAKHKKHHTANRKTTRRSHKMGAVNSQILTPVLMIAGGVAGKYLVNKFMAQQNDTIKGAVLIGAGILASNYAKNNMIQAGGNGLIVAGGLTVVKSIKPALFGATDDVLVISGDLSEVNGVDQIGADDLHTVNGVDQIGADDFMEY